MIKTWRDIKTGADLREFRLRKGWQQREIADELGVSRCTIWGAEVKPWETIKSKKLLAALAKKTHANTKIKFQNPLIRPDAVVDIDLTRKVTFEPVEVSALKSEISELRKDVRLLTADLGVMRSYLKRMAYQEG